MKTTTVSLRQIDLDRISLISDYLTVEGELSGRRATSAAIRFALRVCLDTIKDALRDAPPGAGTNRVIDQAGTTES